MHPENEPVLHVLGNVLGALGSRESLKIAREVLFEQGPDFLDDYLFGAAQAISYDEKWHKQMMIVTKFVNDISNCEKDKCWLKALRVLRNLPINA
ncbi:unnamed protein product [Cylicostephanus goldi]|uniref:Uncharacterized protein n=1 Tax=Cylicostephanus goldi TaxID=71465 RepID=A0A3P7NJM4_CYLGO|nr:unnamed protein product [Cylicostephanus goldi]